MSDDVGLKKEFSYLWGLLILLPLLPSLNRFKPSADLFADDHYSLWKSDCPTFFRGTEASWVHTCMRPGRIRTQNTAEKERMKEI